MLSSVFQTGSISFVFSIQEGVAGIQINILAQSVRTVQLYALQSCSGIFLYAITWSPLTPGYKSGSSSVNLPVQ